MNTNNFGKKIKFTEVFHAIIYIKERELLLTKFLAGDPLLEKVEIANPNYGIDKILYPNAVRKIIFNECKGEGIIIGQTTKKEGFFHPGYIDTFGVEGEQASLEVKKVYSFWVVAVGMCKIKLVPKDSKYEIIP
jgi:hypothetical protein